MKSRRRITIDSLFKDEKGITTTAMAVSIMVSLALVFTGAQAYKATSASAEIQEVADACSLAAESEIAEFMVCVKVCDATVLSLSLLAGASFGIGIVCACAPPLKAVSDSLIKIGNKALKARQDFAKKAADGLNKLQNVLPFLSAAAAETVAQANGSGALKGDYAACAFLLSQKGKKIEIASSDDLDDSASEITDNITDIQKKASEAEEAAKEAQKAKEEAFKLDCGNAPGYCQYERAGRFPWMPASENPSYTNVDAWSFSVALDRAKSYYAYREGREEEPSGTVADKASYFVRMKFYSYAFEKLETEGYVNEGASSFSAHFPKLYRNMAEFRQTPLYTNASFPVSFSESEEKGVMHAWSGCPAAANITSHDCVAALDADVYIGCEVCNFSVESLGNVASASTNISNGFEYHYERIRQAAEKYQEAISKVDPLKDELETTVGPLFKSLSKALKKLGGGRISAEPPGSLGCIAVVINKSSSLVDDGFENLFIRNAGTLGTRVAVSGATLVEDSSDSSANVISSLLDGFADKGGAAVGGARIALDCWAGLLKAYETGQASIEKAISNAMSSITFGTLSGIGDWAAGAFKDALSEIGLEPANLNALKPAILNTGHIVSRSHDTFAVNYSKTRSRALSLSSSSGGLFPGISSWLTEKVSGLSDSEVTIAEIEFPIGGTTIPVKIAIPSSITSVSNNVLTESIQKLEALNGNLANDRVWQ